MAITDKFRHSWAEMLYEALLEVTEGDLKEEVARRISDGFAANITEDSIEALHKSPKSFARMYWRIIKDENFHSRENGYDEYMRQLDFPELTLEEYREQHRKNMAKYKEILDEKGVITQEDLQRMKEEGTP